MKFTLSVSTSFCISGFYIFVIGMLWLITLISCQQAGTCGVQHIAGGASFVFMAVVPFVVACRLFYLAHYRKKLDTGTATSGSFACLVSAVLGLYQFINDPGDAILFAIPALVNSVVLATALRSFPKPRYHTGS